MDFSETWKSKFPISSSFAPPLLLSDPETLGPLFFNPIPKTLIPLLKSPSLSPPPSFFPRLSLSRFLHTSSSIPPSLSNSLAQHYFSPNEHESGSRFSVRNNGIQLLNCPGNDKVLVFFATGENHDQIGFVTLQVKDSSLKVRADDNHGDDVFLSMKKLNHRILKILVNPVDDFAGGKSEIVFGYLLVCTLYSVNWFSVKIIGRGLKNERISLVFLNSKVFKTCAVTNACWNPHLSEECLVLLESGDLFLFDVDSFSKSGGKGKNLRVSFDNLNDSEKRQWLGCCFSWHPQILIVASSRAVFSVDCRFSNRKVSCLANIEALGNNGSVEKNQFVVFSKAGSDGFYFTVASNRRLFLFDIRKPMVPVLQWDHTLDTPCYIDVFSLSYLRSYPSDDTYNFASQSGYCIMMGSFWNSEFCIFCYGPNLLAFNCLTSSKIAKFYNSIYAWDLPSELSVLGRECRCGNCLTREEFLKDSLPEWVDLQQKKEIVLGFGILDKNVSKMFSGSYESGGFTLVRLTSSGKLELQRYRASWDCVTEFKEAHNNQCTSIDNYFLYFEDEEYKFPKRFKYLKLDYLHAFLKGNLLSALSSRAVNLRNKKKDSFSDNLFELLLEKLKSCGVVDTESALTVSNVIKEATLPTTVHELAVSRMWIGLPTDILKLAFSCYPELLEIVVDKKKTSLEFLSVPDQPQFPPFLLRKPSLRSNRWTKKVQRGNALVGPVVPLPVLYTFHEIRKPNLYNYETQLALHCNEVKQTTIEMGFLDSSSGFKNYDTVSLANDKEESWSGSEKSRIKGKSKHFVYNRGCGFDRDENFGTLISKCHGNDRIGRRNTVGLELFDDLCPVELKFDDHAMNMGREELKSYSLLKRQFSRWQGKFDLYQNFCDRSQTTKTT